MCIDIARSVYVHMCVVIACIHVCACIGRGCKSTSTTISRNGFSCLPQVICVVVPCVRARVNPLPRWCPEQKTVSNRFQSNGATHAGIRNPRLRRARSRHQCCYNVPECAACSNTLMSGSFVASASSATGRERVHGARRRTPEAQGWSKKKHACHIGRCHW